MRIRGSITALAALSLLTAGWSQTHLEDVVYGHKSGMALTMDVVKPAKPNGAAIVWMVSGGWVSDHKSINPGLAALGSSRGYTVFQVCHGSQPKFTLSEILKDVTRAIRFIRTNAQKFGVDPNKIGVAGASAGGHLSLMLGSHGEAGDAEAKDPIDRASSEVNAVVAFFPPTDMMNWGKGEMVAIDQPMLRPFWPAFGVNEKTPKEKIAEMAKEFSPIYAFSAKMPPTLFIHGDKDPLVPIQQSQIASDKLAELKVPTKFIIHPGGAHGWPNMVPELGEMINWFDAYLKPNKP